MQDTILAGQFDKLEHGNDGRLRQVSLQDNPRLILKFGNHDAPKLEPLRLACKKDRP